LEDCNDASGYSENVSGMTAEQASLTVLHGDIFRLEGVCDGAGDEYCYYEKTGLSVYADLYPYWVCRIKTSVGSNGLGAKVIVEYADSTTKTLVGSTAPEFSSTWKVFTGTLTDNKTITKIRFYADDYPDTVASGTYQVYYDFLLFCKGTFAIPYSTNVDVAYPNRYVDIPIPGRGNPITQYIGASEPIMITLRGDMLTSTQETWGTASYPYGEYLLYIWHKASSDPWQWFTSDQINCKVTPRAPILRQAGDTDRGAQRIYDYPLALYSLSNIDESTWSGLQWLGK